MLNFSLLLPLGLIIRLMFIAYGEWHDRVFVVPFTDIDYKVFTDAARHVVNGSSPYLRHTYRYPPLLAWLLVPNIILHQCWGKVIFSLFDILVSYIVQLLVQEQGFSKQTAQRCSMFWLFNPVSIIISTRGNSDSFIAAIVLVTLLSVTKDRPAIAGLLIGLAIHVRLYPIIYSLAMYLSFKEQKTAWNIKSFIFPNKKQLTLVFCCFLFLAASTCSCYYLYGSQYLNESILYHLTRKDTRHNFSLFFYLLYLEPEQPTILLFLPQIILLILLAVTFRHRQNLSFCLFAQSFVFVTYNPVVTSQYWIWVLSLMAPIIPRLKLSLQRALFLCGIWILSQLAWLVPAYLLEFRGRNTFLFIWIQSVGVFFANIAVLVRLIRDYDSFKPSEQRQKLE